MEPPPRKRICLALNMPKPAPNSEQSASDRRNNGRHVTLTAVMPRVDNYMVRSTPPAHQGNMEGNFYALVKKAWERSPRMHTGVTTVELVNCGITRITRILQKTATELGCESQNHVFPLIKRNRCRPELRDGLPAKTRLVPVWMLVFVMHRIGVRQFSKFNDRFRVLFDLLDEMIHGATDATTGILEHVPELVRESIVLAARKADQLLESYHDRATRAVYADMPVLDAEVNTLRGQFIASQETTRNRLSALEERIERLESLWSS